MTSMIDSQKNPGCFYEILELIGEGGQAKVYKVLLKKQEKSKIKVLGVYAAKIIEKESLRDVDPEK